MTLRWPYSQARDPRWKVLGPSTANGACFALSVQFIICTATGVNFTKWLKPPDPGLPEGGLNGEPGVGMPFYQSLADRLLAQHQIANTVVTRMAEQARRIAEAAEHEGAVEKYRYCVELVTAGAAVRPLLDPHGIAFQPLKLSRHRSMATTWAAEIAKDPGLKYISITSLNGEGRSGHGIAGIVQGGQYGIFDPNFGIFASGNEADFATDIADIFETRYTQTHHWTITAVNFATFA